MAEIYDPQALRRELHEMPELALHEEKTAAYVAEKLEALGIETHRNVGGTTGVLGIIRGKEPGPVMMLRADMDALPFVIDGKPCCIHACGHDGHTAMLLAAASRLKDKEGRGAHASRPHLGVNAIDVSCAVIEGVQAIWLDPKMSWSSKATQIHADAGATNTVPDKARITFDVRAQTNDLMDALLKRMEEVVNGTAAAYGAKGKLIRNAVCPACWYDDDFTAEVADAIRETAGEENLAHDCGGGGEDFHFYKLHRPQMKAAYFGVGVGATPGLHAATMHFDDSLLKLGVNVFENMVLRHLG